LGSSDSPAIASKVAGRVVCLVLSWVRPWPARVRAPRVLAFVLWRVDKCQSFIPQPLNLQLVDRMEM
jgi:hypothetical protein